MMPEPMIHRYGPRNESPRLWILPFFTVLCLLLGCSKASDDAGDAGGGALDCGPMAGGADKLERVWMKDFLRSATDIEATDDGGFVVAGAISKSQVIEGVNGPITIESRSDDDLFLIRFNSDGKALWARTAGTEGSCCSEKGGGIAVLGDGTILWAGTSTANTAFGEGEANETTLEREEVFLARYESDGQLGWARNLRIEGKVLDLELIDENSFVLAGMFEGTAWFSIDDYEGHGGDTGADGDVDGDADADSDAGSVTTDAGEDGGEPAEIELSSEDGQIFMAAYSLEGRLLWAKQAGGEAEEYLNDVDVLNDGTFAVTGYFVDKAVFGKGEPNETVLDSGNPKAHAIFIAKYDSEGRLLWAKAAGGKGECHESSDFTYCGSYNGRGVQGLSDGSLIVTGSFSESMTFGKGESHETMLVEASGDDVGDSARATDMFVARYNSDGDFAWARSAGSSASGVDGEIGDAVIPLKNGMVLVVGNYNWEGVVFGRGEPTETELCIAGLGYMTWIFMANYSLDGSFNWVQVENAGGEPGSTINWISSPAVLKDGSFVISGEGAFPPRYSVPYLSKYRLKAD